MEPNKHGSQESPCWLMGGFAWLLRELAGKCYKVAISNPSRRVLLVSVAAYCPVYRDQALTKLFHLAGRMKRTKKWGDHHHALHAAKQNSI